MKTQPPEPGRSPDEAARFAALVPAYQAEAHLADVLRRILAHLAPDAVFVIDDGSTDRTAEIARGVGVQLVQHPQNRGKGAALETGFETTRAAGFTHVLTLDSDGQHPPECIPSFLEASSRADIVLGSRMREADRMPPSRRFSNRSTAIILSALARQTIEDGQTGYRLIALRALDGLRFDAKGFMLESELLIKASRKGARITHVPIPCVYGDETSHIHAARDTLRFLSLVLRSFFW